MIASPQRWQGSPALPYAASTAPVRRASSWWRTVSTSGSSGMFATVPGWVQSAVGGSGNTGLSGRVHADVFPSLEFLMSVRALDSSNLSDTLATNPIVVLDFYADWCGPCRVFAPVFERAAETNPDIVFAKVDVDRNPDLAREFDVRSIPSLVAVRDDIVVHYSSGALSPRELDEVLDRVRSLDMDEVRRHLDSAQPY